MEILFLVSGVALFAALTVAGIYADMRSIKLLNPAQTHLWTTDFEKQRKRSTLVTVMCALGIPLALIIWNVNIFFVIVGYFFVSGVCAFILAAFSVRSFAVHEFPPSFVRQFFLNKVTDIVAWGALMLGIAYGTLRTWGM